MPSLSTHFWLTTFPYILSIAGTTVMDQNALPVSLCVLRPPQCLDQTDRRGSVWVRSWNASHAIDTGLTSMSRVQCTDSFVVGQSIYYRRGARLASERYRDSVHEKGRYAEIGWTAPDA